MGIKLEKIERKIHEKDEARVIYLLFEGEVTEPFFIDSFLSNSQYISSREVIFKKVIKTESDKGASHILKMKQIAVNDIFKLKKFRKNYDKCIIMYDLDIFENNKQKIIETIELKYKDIIYAYTNPSIELFLSLTFEGSYEKYIKIAKNAILRNNYVDDNKRFINALFQRLAKFNPKKNQKGLRLLGSNFEVALKQEERFLNRFIDKAYNELTSNIGYIFKMIKENKINEIKYFYNLNNQNNLV